jgi:hypothetical protein
MFATAITIPSTQVKDSHKRFQEAVPANQAQLLVDRLESWDAPVTVISDAAVALYMRKADMVLVGAKGEGRYITLLFIDLGALDAARQPPQAPSFNSLPV